MKASTFTMDQVCRLRQIERERTKVGLPGFRSKLQDFILRMVSETQHDVFHKSDADPKNSNSLEAQRTHQAEVLYYKGWGKELGFKTFETYLATVPDIPDELLADDERFPHLVLVDARLGVKRTCELLNVAYGGDDNTFIPFDEKCVRTEKVYWIRVQDGRKNCGKSVQSCRESFAHDEIGLTAHEGLSLFVQNLRELKGRGMDFPGTVYCGLRGCAAFLGWFDCRPTLFWNCEVERVALYGSASRRM